MAPAINKLQCCILLLIPATAPANIIGLGVGMGSPNSLSGERLHYRNPIYSHAPIDLFAEASIGRWDSTATLMPTNHILALAPVVRATISYPHNIKIYLEMSIGAAWKSTRYVGNKRSGSHWNFQDMVGIGTNIGNNFEVHMHIIHYSNAALAKPNPSIDVFPLIGISYKF